MSPLKSSLKFLPALVLTLTGLALLVIGTRLGGRDTVFIKAVNLCMECIGLG